MWIYVVGPLMGSGLACLLNILTYDNEPEELDQINGMGETMLANPPILAAPPKILRSYSITDS